MNRALFFTALLFACSPVKGTPLIDAAMLTIDSMQIMPGSASLRLGLDPPAKLVVNAALSDGTTRDITNYVTWSSSDDTVASIPFGALTAVHAGTAVVTAAYGPATAMAQVTVRDAMIAVTTEQITVPAGTLPTGIVFFDALASGSATPLREIRGSDTTQLTNPFSLDVDGSNNELYVADNETGVWVFPLDGSGSAVMPLRHIPVTSTATPTMTQMTFVLAVRVVGDEVFVAGEALGSNNTNVGAVAVYSRLADGSGAAPLRLISGSNTTLSTAVEGMGVAGGKIYVANLSPPEIAVFDSDATGDIAPSQVVSTPPSVSPMTLQPTLAEPIDVHVFNNELYVSDISNGILVFPLDAGSNANPTRWLHGPDTMFSVTTDMTQIGETLVCAQNNTSVLTTSSLEATGDIAPMSVLTGSATGFQFPIGLVAF